MKKILILAFNDLKHDARVMRQINFLKESYSVTIVCFDGFDSPEYNLIQIKKIKPSLVQKITVAIFLIIRFYEIAYKILYDYPTLRQTLKSQSFDLIVANDIECLPLAISLKKKEKISYDAHEYAPRHFEDKLVWRLFFQGFNKYLCKKYLPLTNVMTTVAAGLAKEYASHYPVHPVVITNTNYYFNIDPFPVSKEKIRLIHHGAANPSRQLELMIEMMDYLDDRFSLNLMLLTSAIANKKTRYYLNSLKELVHKNPKVKIINPVKSEEVIYTICQYDMGIFLLPPINFNYANTLPNKLFDYIQARLAVAIGPTPEMSNIVTTYDVGVVSQEFTPQSIARVLNELTTEKIEYYKRQSDMAAKELSAEKNKIILNSLVSQLLNS